MQSAINKLRERRRDGEEGFTLIELMVVVLIIAILLAIAIPTFLGARKRAQERAAQSTLRNSLTSAKTIYTDSQDYTTANVAALNLAEPTITHQTAESTGPKQVSVATPDKDTWYGASKSDSKMCFYIQESTATGTKFGKADVSAAAATCVATASPTGGYIDKW